MQTYDESSYKGRFVQIEPAPCGADSICREKNCHTLHKKKHKDTFYERTDRFTILLNQYSHLSINLFQLICYFLLKQLLLLLSVVFFFVSFWKSDRRLFQQQQNTPAKCFDWCFNLWLRSKNRDIFLNNLSSQKHNIFI